LVQVKQQNINQMTFTNDLTKEFFQDFVQAFDKGRANATDKEANGTPGLNAVKALYKKLMKAHHPDLGGDVEKAQAINEAYDLASSHLTSTGHKHNGDTWGEDGFWKSHMNSFQELIDQLLKLEGLELELIGSWLWVSGETRDHKETLKELGLKWSGKRKMWFLNPSGKKRRGRASSISTEQLRDFYGSIDLGKGKGKKEEKEGTKLKA
jgi:curved DNA-binding protein CbpA